MTHRDQGDTAALPHAQEGGGEKQQHEHFASASAQADRSDAVVAPVRVLAFMQNMWVRDPDRTRRIFQRTPQARRRIIYYALFAGCVSGQRLKAAFGPDLCKRIMWEEASPVVTGRANEAPSADPDHIRACLETDRPDIVIAFGNLAINGVRPLWNGRLVTAPHPAARQPDVPRRLSVAADELRQAMALRPTAAR